jgi:hypothetical protein
MRCAQGELSHVCVLARHIAPASPQFASVTHATHVLEEGSQNVGAPPSGPQSLSLAHCTQLPAGLQTRPARQLLLTKHCTQKLLAEQ